MVDNTRADSFLERAEAIWDIIKEKNLPRSAHIGQCQIVFEQASKAILIKYGVKSKHHDVDTVSRENANKLAPIWGRLQPLIDEYNWLWNWRNKSFYAHNDAPPIVNEPEITSADVDKAHKLAEDMVKLAKEVFAN